MLRLLHLILFIAWVVLLTILPHLWVTWELRPLWSENFARIHDSTVLATVVVGPLTPWLIVVLNRGPSHIVATFVTVLRVTTFAAIAFVPLVIIAQLNWCTRIHLRRALLALVLVTEVISDHVPYLFAVKEFYAIDPVEWVLANFVGRPRAPHRYLHILHQLIILCHEWYAEAVSNRPIPFIDVALCIHVLHLGLTHTWRAAWSVCAYGLFEGVIKAF